MTRRRRSAAAGGNNRNAVSRRRSRYHHYEKKKRTAYYYYLSDDRISGFAFPLPFPFTPPPPPMPGSPPLASGDTYSESSALPLISACPASVSGVRPVEKPPPAATPPLPLPCGGCELYACGGCGSASTGTSGDASPVTHAEGGLGDRRLDVGLGDRRFWRGGSGRPRGLPACCPPAPAPAPAAPPRRGRSLPMAVATRLGGGPPPSSSVSNMGGAGTTEPCRGRVMMISGTASAARRAFTCATTDAATFSFATCADFVSPDPGNQSQRKGAVEA